MGTALSYLPLVNMVPMAYGVGPRMLEAAVGEEQGLENSACALALFTLPFSIHLC